MTRTRMRAAHERTLAAVVEARAVVWITGADTPAERTAGTVVGVDLDGVLVDLGARGCRTLVPLECEDPGRRLMPAIVVAGVTP